MTDIIGFDSFNTKAYTHALTRLPFTKLQHLFSVQQTQEAPQEQHAHLVATVHRSACLPHHPGRLRVLPEPLRVRHHQQQRHHTGGTVSKNRFRLQASQNEDSLFIIAKDLTLA